MARFKNHVLVVIGFTLAGMIGAAFGTGTAQAVVSTLVTAVNTAANPVPTSVVNPGTSPVLNSSVDDPGRIAYQSTISLSSCFNINNCGVESQIVPAGHRVVIQHIMGRDSLIQRPTFVFFTATLSNGVVASSFFVGFTAQDYVFDQPTLFYVDSGNTVGIQLATDGVFRGIASITLTGYELDCTVAACAPIATQ